jgi:hypothetical protein
MEVIIVYISPRRLYRTIVYREVVSVFFASWQKIQAVHIMYV